MTTKLCVFVSSVQKELEDERLIVQNLMTTDVFLSGLLFARALRVWNRHLLTRRWRDACNHSMAARSICS